MFWARLTNGKVRHVFDVKVYRFPDRLSHRFYRLCQEYETYEEIMLDRDPATPRLYCKRCARRVGIQHDGYIDYATRSLMPPEDQITPYKEAPGAATNRRTTAEA